MLLHRKQFILLIIGVLMVNYVKSQCAEQNPCRCIRPDGMGLSLEGVAALGPFKSNNGSVVFQPCKNTNLTFEHSVPQTNGTDDCHNTSLCLLDAKNLSINLGMIEETHWIWPLHRNPELKILHKNKESRIELMCSNPGNKPILTLQKKETNVLRFQLSSDKLCMTDMRPKGLSTGSVLVILFFVFTGLYFIGGALLLAYCRGAVGKETIPNYEFWSDLPALVRDGITFTLTGCSAVSYEQI